MTTLLDQLLTEHNLSNNDLVNAYHELGKQISHKTIQKARTGSRPLSRNMQMQVVDALNSCAVLEKRIRREDLFPAADRPLA